MTAVGAKRRFAEFSGLSRNSRPLDSEDRRCLPCFARARWRESQIAARSKDKAGGHYAADLVLQLPARGPVPLLCIPSCWIDLIGSAERRLTPLHAGMVRPYQGRLPRNWNGGGYPLVQGAYSCSRNGHSTKR